MGPRGLLSEVSKEQPAPCPAPCGRPTVPQEQARPQTQSGHSLLTVPFLCNWPGPPTCQDRGFRGERQGEFPDDVCGAVVHEEAQIADGRVQDQRDHRGEGTQDPVPSSLQSLIQTLDLVVFALRERRPRGCFLASC